MVCCPLSNVCVAASSYQSSANHASFIFAKFIVPYSISGSPLVRPAERERFKGAQFCRITKEPIHSDKLSCPNECRYSWEALTKKIPRLRIRKPNRSPAQWVRFRKEPRQNEQEVPFAKKSPRTICRPQRRGGSGGIRTHVPSRTTAFRVRLVTTTSIRFQNFRHVRKRMADMQKLLSIIIRCGRIVKTEAD